jgi:hypothetical protein
VFVERNMTILDATSTQIDDEYGCQDFAL